MGQHTRDILTELGYSKNDVDIMIDSNVVEQNEDFIQSKLWLFWSFHLFFYLIFMVKYLFIVENVEFYIQNIIELLLCCVFVIVSFCLGM